MKTSKIETMRMIGLIIVACLGTVLVTCSMFIDGLLEKVRV